MARTTAPRSPRTPAPLLVILSSITYWFYSSAMRTCERDIQYADKIRLARVLLDRMAHEIRQATIQTADGGELKAVGGVGLASVAFDLIKRMIAKEEV